MHNVTGYTVSSIQILRQKWRQLIRKVSSDDRSQVLFPKPILDLARIIVNGDKKIVSLLEESMDKFISVLTVLLVLVGAVLVGFFFVVQVFT